MSTINAPVPMTVSCDNEAVQMNVGMKMTTGTTSVTDKKPYLFRASAANSADVAVDKIIGGTVAWNQMVQDGNFPNTDKWDRSGNASLSVSDNVMTVHRDSGTGIVGGACVASSVRRYSVSGHKYLICFTIQTINGIVSSFPTGASSDGNTGYIAYPNKTEKAWIWNCQVSKQMMLELRGYTGSGVTSTIDFTVENYMCFDLTAMYGSTIADYIYALEQSNSRSGVAYFRKLFPKPYYAYNAGELLSVQTNLHRMVGFNQWDEEWELGYYDQYGAAAASSSNIRSKNYIRVLPNTTYYIKTGGKAIYVCEYDASKTFVPNSRTGWTDHLITTGANTYYLRFNMAGGYGTTYNHDICINLHWDGERDGEYEPYTAHTYALDSNLELRGIPKLDASNNLYYDGDEYAADGTVTRRYASRAFTSGDATDGSTMITDGTTTVYKLTTPTTESADPYTNPQAVSADGTEEYVDDRDVPIPVGHETQYVTRQTAETSVDAYPMTVTHGIEV